MCRLLLLLLLSVSVAPSLAVAADQPEFPKGEAPRFVMIVRLDKAKGRLEYQYAVEQPVSEEVVVVSEKDGAKVEQVVTRTRMVREIRQASVAMNSIEITNRDGIKLTEEECWQRLPLGGLALQSADANGVDLAYRKLLAKEALILVPRRRVERQE